MNELECPYCGFENQTPLDDAFLEQYVLHKHHCDNCEKNFIFETEVSVTFHPRRASCLNGGQHTWKKTYAEQKNRTKMMCTQCGEYRNPTRSEMEVILKD